MMRRRLDVERVRLALRASDFGTPNKVAEAAGLPHSVLSRLLTGSTTKVNQSTLVRLARALGVSKEWLTGESADLPKVPKVEQHGGGQSLWGQPTRGYVLLSGLMRRADKALRRDLGDWCGDRAGDAYAAWGEALLRGFSLLASSQVWREAMLGSSPWRSPRELLRDGDTHAVTWLTNLLTPWFAGGAYLDARTVGGVYRALMATSIWSLEKRDSETLQAFAEYARLCERAEAQHFERVLGPEPQEEAGPKGGESGGARGQKRTRRRAKRGR